MSQRLVWAGHHTFFSNVFISSLFAPVSLSGPSCGDNEKLLGPRYRPIIHFRRNRKNPQSMRLANLL
jgi:hypothetical protein